MRVAVITPYYKETTKQLLQCHRSVLNQTHKEVRHIIVSDGHPNADVDTWDCDHIKIPNSGDYGDTPRGIGAAIASIQGYDAICFLDADCWYDPDHLEEMIAAQKRTGAPVITCARNLYRPNNLFMRVDDESDGENFCDTNCYLFIAQAFTFLRLWLFKTKKQAMFGDRALWDFIVKAKVPRGRSIRATVNYVTTFANHYIGIGEEPPPMSKIFITINNETRAIPYEAYKRILVEQEKNKAAKKQEIAMRSESKEPVTVVCWLWNDPNLPYAFKPEYVNTLASMLSRNLTVPHQLVCITDIDASGFNSDVKVIPIPESVKPFLSVKTPEGKEKPSCYRRLWLFSEEAKSLGSKILMIDIDFVITGNIDHIVGYTDDFVGWQNPTPWAWGTNYFIGCLWLHRTGTRTHLWDNFITNPEKAISDARSAGFRGSDQAWISYNLYGKEKMFSGEDGIYSILDHKTKIPANAKLIQFNGPDKPWSLNYPWIKENWK